MSNWHSRGGQPDGNAYSIIFHVPVPSANNRVGINYRTALVGSGIGGVTQMTEGVSAGQITTAEKADILSGAVIEHQETIFTNPGETALQLRDRLDARYTELANASGTFIQGLKGRLDYWGLDRNVP